jgi:hypothetical protein
VNVNGWQSGLVTAGGKKKPSYVAFAHYTYERALAKRHAAAKPKEASVARGERSRGPTSSR